MTDDATHAAANVHARERRVTPAKDSLDFFITPDSATQALVDREVFPGAVWECACGNGAMTRVLEGAGYRVRSTDVVDRGFGAGGVDFLLEPGLPDGVQSIVTNPPFRLATQFAQHALDLGARKVALLCRVAFLEGRERGEGIFADSCLSRVWVFSRRITLWAGDLTEADREGRSGGAMAFAWFVFERHHRGTSIGWIL